METPPETSLKLKAQILVGEVIAIGPGKAHLLAAIAKTGSIAAAGRTLGISYRRTRNMIDVLNSAWALPLIATAKGGASGGGSQLTEHGKQVLAAYRELELALESAGQEQAKDLLTLLGSG